MTRRAVRPRAGMRTLPDGTFMMANQPIRSIIMAAAPVPVRDVTGLPAFVRSIAGLSGGIVNNRTGLRAPTR